MHRKSNHFLSELPQTYFLHRDGALTRVVADNPDELRYLRAELEILKRIGRKSKSWQGVVELFASNKYSETDHTEIDRIMLDAGHPLIEEMIALFDQEYGEIKDEILLSIVDEEAANIVQQAAECGVLKMIEKKDGIVHMTNPYGVSLPSDIEDALAAAENALAKAASLIPDDPNEDDTTARNDGTILDTLKSMAKEVHEEDDHQDDTQTQPLEFLEEDKDQSDHENDILNANDDVLKTETKEDGNDAPIATQNFAYQDTDLSLLNQSHPINPYAVDPDSDELESMELDTSYVSQEEQQTNIENMFDQYNKITEKHLTLSSQQPVEEDQNETPSPSRVEHQDSELFELPEPEAIISAAMDQPEQPATMDSTNQLTEPEITNEENENSTEDQTPNDASFQIKDPDPEAVFAAEMDKLELSPQKEPDEPNEQEESIHAADQLIMEETSFQNLDLQSDSETTTPENSPAVISDEDSSNLSALELNNSANDETENHQPLDQQPDPMTPNKPVSPFASIHQPDQQPETKTVDESQPSMMDESDQDYQTSQYDEPFTATLPVPDENEQAPLSAPVDNMEQPLVLDANQQITEDQNIADVESDISEPPILKDINEPTNEAMLPDEITEPVSQSKPELDCLPIVAQSQIPEVHSHTETTTIDQSAPQSDDQETPANHSSEAFDLEYTPERAQQAVVEIEKGIRKIAGVLNTEVNDQWKTAQQSLEQINDVQTNVNQSEQNVETMMLEITQLKEEIQTIRDEADTARQEARQYREEARIARERAVASAEMAELAADQANKEVENARKAMTHAVHPSS